MANGEGRTGGALRTGLACALFAALLRTAWILAIDVDPRRDFHFDMTWYDLAALALLDGRILTNAEGVPTAFWPPGYPALLAAVYAAFGSSLRTAQALNVGLAALACGLTCALGLRAGAGLRRPARCALLAGMTLALFPGYVFFAPLTLSENAFVALLAGILLVWVRLEQSTGSHGSSRRLQAQWLGFGALIGVAMLTRGAAALFAVVPIAVAWFETRSARIVAERACALLLGVAIAVLPWTARNFAVLGAPVVVSTSVGMALLYAHSPVADGSESLRMVAHRRELLKDLQSLPNPEREVREMQVGVASALRYAVSHPLQELGLVPRRLVELFRHDRAGLEWARPDRSATTPLVGSSLDRVLGGVANAYFFAICGLAALGAWLRRRDAPVRMLTAASAYFVALHAFVFVGNPRYHVPLYPILAVLAAVGALELGRRMRERSPQSR